MAGGTMIREDFGPLLTGIAQVVEEEMALVPTREWMRFFNVEGSDKIYELFLQLVGFGLPSRKASLERPIVDSPKLGFAVKFVHSTFAIMCRMSVELKMDDQTGRLVKAVPKMAKQGFGVLSEYQHADIFNLGFVTNGYEPDGVSLFNTAHPLVDGGSGGQATPAYTSSNRSATDAALSVSSLWNARVIGQRTLSNSGKLEPRTFNRLIVGPGQSQIAAELTRSILKPGQFAGGTQPNDININHGEWTTEIWNYLDETTLPGAWYVAQPKEQTGLVHYDREKLTDARDVDVLARVLYWAWFTRYSYGYHEWRAVYGSRGSG